MRSSPAWFRQTSGQPSLALLTSAMKGLSSISILLQGGPAGNRVGVMCIKSPPVLAISMRKNGQWMETLPGSLQCGNLGGMLLEVTDWHLAHSKNQLRYFGLAQAS